MRSTFCFVFLKTCSGRFYFLLNDSYAHYSTMPIFLYSYVNWWLFVVFSLLCTHSVCSCSSETSSASFSFLYFKFNEFRLLGLCWQFTAGNIVCSWGRGEDGQLGHADAEDRFLPTQLSALDSHEIVSVTCGADHTTAYSRSLLEVYSWGWSVYYLLMFSLENSL